jgi:hypothetical protein
MSGKLGLNAFAACVLACAAMAGRAEADSVTYVFDHYTVPPHVAPHTPIPGGNYGTLTISTSLVDPNRIDLTLTAIPHPAYAGGTLEKFYVNFATPFLTNHKFYLLPVTAPAGSISPTLGSVQYANGVTTFNFANFVFDVTVDPTSTSLTFAGSLALYNELPNPDVQVSINVGMFDLTSGGTNSPPMYAGYRLHNYNTTDPNFPDGEFWAFASGEQQTTIPEPVTALLLGTGLLGIAASRRRRRHARS